MYVSCLSTKFAFENAAFSLFHVCRRVGEEDSQTGLLLLHPLGGLDTTVPPSGWKRQVLASLSGLLFLAAFTILTGIGLAAITEDPDGRFFPSPFMIDRIYEIEMFNSWWLLVLYLFHWASFLLLVANLVPSPPMRAWISMS